MIDHLRRGVEAWFFPFFNKSAYAFASSSDSGEMVSGSVNTVDAPSFQSNSDAHEAERGSPMSEGWQFDETPISGFGRGCSRDNGGDNSSEEASTRLEAGLGGSDRER